jgi:hypothetical protein
MMVNGSALARGTEETAVTAIMVKAMIQIGFFMVRPLNRLAKKPKTEWFGHRVASNLRRRRKVEFTATMNCLDIPQWPKSVEKRMMINTGPVPGWYQVDNKWALIGLKLR